MGQVPKNDSPSSLLLQKPIGLVGRGRTATHLKFYLESLGLTVQNWHRGLATDELDQLRACDVILLAISDSQIEYFVVNEPWLIQKTLVHFSGAMSSAIVKCAHPLVSFGPKLFDLDFYKTIPFVTELENPLDFNALIPQLPNPIFSISQDQKARYHALCVSANNFTTILWQKYFEAFQNEFAISADHSSSLFKSTALNLQADWKKALTGPLVRKDWETIEKNIAALEGDDLQPIYEAFVLAYDNRQKAQVNYIYLEPGEMGL